MKTLHLTTISAIGIGAVFLVFLLTIMTHSKVLAVESFCDQNLDHGTTLGKTIGQKQCENPVYQMNYNGVNLTVINAINETTFKMGENIIVIPELISTGNHNVTISYCGPLFMTVVMDQFGKIVWPQYSWACPLFMSDIRLAPNTPTGEGYDQNITLNLPGNYTLRSLASFDGASDSTVLWSKPLQITVLPEKVPEFPFAQIILVLGIISSVVIYRIRK